MTNEERAFRRGFYQGFEQAIQMELQGYCFQEIASQRDRLVEWWEDRLETPDGSPPEVPERQSESATIFGMAMLLDEDWPFDQT
jgi:hypothetical protein